MRRVFLSYHDDTADYARRLRAGLTETFGADCVVDVLDDADAVLAFIGPGLLPEPELEDALARGLLIALILIDGATYPAEADLPEPLRLLAHANALEIPEPASEFDAEAVARQLTELVHPRAVAGNGGGGEAGAPPPSGDGMGAGSPVTVGPAPEAELGVLLREAARAGVVPASARVPAPPAAAQAPPPPPAYTEPPPEYAAPPAASRGLLRIALPIAIVGAGFLVAAKWLLGWFLTDTEVPAPADEVVCTVFAPPAAAPGDTLLVQAFAHLPEQADDARAIATELDADAQRRAFQSLSTRVARESQLHFELRLPGLEVDDPVAALVWRGRAEAVQFGVRVPAGTSEGTVIGTLEVSLDAAPVGHIKFKLEISRAAAPSVREPQGETARRYTAAFVSYASADRAQVLARVQMLSIAGVRYFQDVLSLEPGDRWERRLELGIDECDVFLLFWSSNAKRSEWVRKEVAYALARAGGNELAPPEIRPVILEGPPVVKPWEELAHLHFNDRLTYFMRPPGAG